MMNKEENNHTRNQKRMYRIHKQEERIQDLELLVGTLQQENTQLKESKQKLDKIKEYCKNKNDELNDFKKSTINDSFNVNIEKFIKDILSIIGGE